MLNKSYSSCIVGKNFLSLIHGIKELKGQKTCCLLDDESLFYADQWIHNLGRLEVLALKTIGDKYQIKQLTHIEDYLSPKSTILHLNHKVIEFGPSPYFNIKELGRKLPDALGAFFRDELKNINPEEFDLVFLNMLETYNQNLWEKKNYKNAASYLSSLKENETKNVYLEFINFIRSSTHVSKQLHYVLQMMFQIVFSAGQNSLETQYLLSSVLAPRYELKYKKLEQDLSDEFIKLNGAIRKTSIKDFGVTEDGLQFLLLSSIDGVVKVNKTFFYGQMNETSYPFSSHKHGTRFLSIKLESSIEHELVHHFVGKRIVFSHEKRMGSDFPFWEIDLTREGKMTGVFAYADYQGTKASFYYHHALEDLYESLDVIFPGIDRSDWFATTKLSVSSDIWLEVDQFFKKQYHPDSNHDLDKFYGQLDGKKILQFANCGPERSKSLGLYGQLVDIFHLS